MRAVALTLALLAAPAQADDYPFQGVFTYHDGTTPATARDQLKCAFNFFTQGADGRGRDYVLDLKRYQAKAQVSFVPVDRFLCQFDALYQTEHCSFSDGVDPQLPAQSYAKILAITPDSVTTQYFPDLAALAAFVGGKAAVPPDTPPGQYLRCKGFDAARLAPYMAADAHAMTVDEVETALGNPLVETPSPALEQIARAVVAKVAP